MKGKVKLYFRVGQRFFKKRVYNLGKNIVIITTESTALFINVPGNGLPYLADDVVN